MAAGPRHVLWNYGFILLLIVASFLWTAAADNRVDRVGRVVLQAAIVLLALRVARVSPRVIRLCAVPIAVAIAGAAVVAARGEDVSQASVVAIGGLLLVAALVAIVRDVRRVQEVGAHELLGLLCIYLLVGLVFAAVYATVDLVGSRPFFEEASDPTSADFLYFSFTTITTVGFGDLTPTGQLGRMIAVVEALFGQLYLVTVVALAVANVGRRRRLPDET